MVEMIHDKPFIVAIMAGIAAQLIKVVSFLIIEKKVNYRRFVQTDGAPNMHISTFSALATAVGLTAGFDSLPFAFAICITSIIVVDTMNVKNATSRQAEAIGLLLARLRRSGHSGVPGNSRNSYTPVDAFSGVLLGILFALLIY
jgi:acid phosphatase family membrane protein YuiD